MKSRTPIRHARWSINKLTQNASIGSYNRSLRYLDNDDEKAFELNRASAEEGLHDAVLAMGWFYLNGVGTEADEAEAVRWYRKSARQGDPRAMFSLGYVAYMREDFADALRWFTRAANKGHDRSNYWIGKMYWRGEEVAEDKRRAQAYFAKAAAKKCGEAQRAMRYLSHLSNTKRT